MSEVESQLNPLYRELVERAEKEFPRASEEYCPDKCEGVCNITGRKCGFRDCPKMQKAKSDTGNNRPHS